MKKKFAALMLVTGFCVAMAACSKSTSGGGNTGGGGNPSVCTGVTAKFSTDVLPLITTKCATNSGCHAAGSSNSGGALTTYAQISARSSNIKTQVATGAMPQGGSLTTVEKNIILCWISSGTPDN